MRDLAAAKDKKHKKLAQAMREKFVFLNVYCKSVKEEHDPRGPEGPYQFQDRSVPVVVIKRWDGKTLRQQLGFGKTRGAERIANWLEDALQKNGPVVPPKALRPLLKAWAKAQEHLAKKRVAAAIRELHTITKKAANKKKFREAPEVADLAAARLKELETAGLAAVMKAANLTDEKDRKRERARIKREYGRIAAVAQALKTS